MNVKPAPDYDFNSEQNILIKKKFCRKEIYGDATDVAEYLLADTDGCSPLKWNFELGNTEHHRCPKCGEEIDLDTMTTPYDIGIEIEIDEDAPLDERFLCPICGSGFPTEEEARECCGSRMIYQCPYCLSAVSSDELDESELEDYPEQWLLVSDWLGEILLDNGEIVLCSTEGLYFWGRLTTPLLEKDSVISDICYSLEILEGQNNFREVKA